MTGETSIELPREATLVCECRTGPGIVRKFRLGNGLTVIVLEDHQAPVAAYQTWFAVGSAHEAAGQTGMAHLFEHLMFKETKNLEAGEFDRILEENGVSSNASTWLDWTYYRESLPADKLELVMRLEADRMENMTLDKAQVDTEREVVKNERLARVENDPDGKLSEVLYDLHFGQHPYGHPTIGWMADIEALRVEDAVRFHQVCYPPANATVVVVGDVDTARVLSLAQQYYGHMQAAAVPARPVGAEPAPRGERTKTVRLSVSAPRIMIIYGAPALASADTPALGVLSEILFNSESSRIRRLLVDERELATELAGWHSGFALTGAYEIQINLVPGADWKEALGILDQEMERVKRDGCTEREVRKGINKQEMSFLRSSISVGSKAHNLGHFEVTTGDFRSILDLLERTRAVTPGQVQDAARRHLRRENRTVVVALPSEERE